MVEKKQKRRSRGTLLVREALEILQALNVLREQQNERSALTFLALLGIAPGKRWAEAQDPLLGITEMMNYFQDNFGKKYAPNTRETVRRFTVHQFVQMELVIANPDDPQRPVNSPDNRYQIAPALLKLVRKYDEFSWGESLEKFLSTADGLRRLQTRERKMALIPVTLPDGRELTLTAGGQNELVKKIVEDFCRRFTPGGVLVYVGDTGNKQRHIEIDYLRDLGLNIDEHGKIPDVIVHLPGENWLVLIEAERWSGLFGQETGIDKWEPALV